MTIPQATSKASLAIEQSEGIGARVRQSTGRPQLRYFSLPQARPGYNKAWGKLHRPSTSQTRDNCIFSLGYSGS
ncbi:hypothetical protein B0O99DRAFT_125106 [Bisporella sp. PMI_857]|nr:hypothetical protein B0O99DRAFT_125106 [Bisporella sp. PMI_857]